MHQKPQDKNLRYSVSSSQALLVQNQNSGNTGTSRIFSTVILKEAFKRKANSWDGAERKLGNAKTNANNLV